MKTSKIPHNSEYLKEGIYGSLTLLAVNLGIFLHIEHTSKSQAFSTIITTILGLWFASLFAEILAHKILHKSESHENLKYFSLHALKNSLGILNSAKSTIFLIILTFFGVLELKTAIFSAIFLMMIEFFLILFFAQKSNNLRADLITIGLQIGIFTIIILLKLGH